MNKEELEKEAEEYASEEDICVCGDEYWSHNDIKQAYLAGAEPREKRIAELEAQIERNKIDLAISEHDREHDDYELTEVYEKVKQLEKVNADLKCECRRCVYTDSPCILSDYGKDRNGICDHFKDVFDENVELKKNYEDSLVACGVLKEKIDLMTKPSPIEAMQDALITTQKVVYEKQKEQLTKAKEIIRMVIDSYNHKERFSFEKDLAKAEQFLKGEVW